MVIEKENRDKQATKRWLTQEAPWEGILVAASRFLGRGTPPWEPNPPLTRPHASTPALSSPPTHYTLLLRCSGSVLAQFGFFFFVGSTCLKQGLLTALVLLVNWHQAELTLRSRQVAVAALWAFKLVGLFDFDFLRCCCCCLLLLGLRPPSGVVVLGISGAGPKGEVSTPGTASRRRLPSDPPP